MATHSSQINTSGPAMSLRTSFCVFLQNEHCRSSDWCNLLVLIVCDTRYALTFESIQPRITSKT